MKIARACFGTKQLNERNSMCKYCPYLIACKRTRRRRKIVGI